MSRPLVGAAVGLVVGVACGFLPCPPDLHGVMLGVVFAAMLVIPIVIGWSIGVLLDDIEGAKSR